jgi:peptidoglycan/LPS O-acetylase OafA/YrhL
LNETAIPPVDATPNDAMTDATLPSSPVAGTPAEDALAAHGDVRPDRHETPPRRRLHALDGLRGLAALGVVLFHFTVEYHKKIVDSPKPAVTVPFGGAGVFLFFVLSGFVIFISLDHVKRLRDFVVSRATRMYPAYWVCVILTFCAVRAFHLPKDNVTVADALLNLTMFEGYIKDAYVDGAYWTLKVEIGFYIVCGLAILTRQVKNLHWILTGLCILALIDAIEENWPVHVPKLVRSLFVLKYLPMFTCGVLAWHLLHAKQRWVAAAQMAVALATLWIAFDLTTALGIGGVVMVVMLATHPGTPILGSAPLRFLGYISYSLYLIHQNIGYIILRAGYARGLNPNVTVAIAIIAMLALATTISLLIEYPAMRYLRKLYRRTQPADGAGTLAQAAR